MDAHHLAQLLEAWLLRARMAMEGGPSLDPKTEAAAAMQALDALFGCQRSKVDEE